MSASDRFDKHPPKIERSRAPSARELALRAELIQVRHELKLLLEDLERVRTQSALPAQSAVVTQVVAKTQLMNQGSQQHQARRD
ncbi:MAG: hypothetical protein JWN04_4560 [Myxococcaceae bacterium]|nr:hypothetical protein [Myxococcaceae bacterium]